MQTPLNSCGVSSRRSHLAARHSCGSCSSSPRDPTSRSPALPESRLAASDPPAHGPWHSCGAASMSTGWALNLTTTTGLPSGHRSAECRISTAVAGLLSSASSLPGSSGPAGESHRRNPTDPCRPQLRQAERLTRTFLRATLVASRPADFGRAKLFAALRSMAAVLCGLRAAPRTISPQRGAATEHDRAYTKAPCSANYL
jgi:hypothetical protein